MTSTALLGSRDLRAALELMTELHDERTVDLLARTVAERLVSLLDADLVSHDDIDMLTGSQARTLLVPRPCTAAPPIARQRLAARVPQLIGYGDDGSSRLVHPDPRVAGGWACGLVAASHQILVAVRASPGRLAGFGLTRWRAPFSVRDVEVVRLVQSHLPAAFEHVALRARAADEPTGDFAEALTVREREVLALISHGLSSREAGRFLRISPRTIEKHVEHIRGKLGARSRAEAVAVALREEALRHVGVGTMSPGHVTRFGDAAWHSSYS